MSELLALVNEVERDEVVEICRDLVRAPSENPPGNEEAVAVVTEQWLTRLGLSSQRVVSAPGRVSVISSWDGEPGPVLAFNGHYDVVPAGDAHAWPHPPFDAFVEDGRIIGRGSSDMKAGIAACLAAVSALRRGGFTPKGRFVMQFVADEEALGLLGAKHLVDNGYCEGIDQAVVGEPTSLHLVTAERGAFWLRIITEGVSAHGSTPQLGVNAIEHMAHVVLAARGMRWRKLHPMLGSPTLNVGTIHGGSKGNMVPDRCVIEIDRRTLPSETREEVLDELEAMLDDVRGRVPDLRAHIEPDGWAEASETPEGTPIVRLLADAREALGAEGSELGYMGATDARYLINQARIPTVVFGPGDISLAHTTGESVEIAQLVAGARIYAHAFARYLGAEANLGAEA
jgi:acetylornithine deacetylase/succinyl-diaminopimelate desuccinylase family protein